MDNDSSINVRNRGKSLSFTEKHSQKCVIMQEHKKQNESKKINASLLELDKKMAKFESEMAQRKARAKKEHEKVQKWLTILNVFTFAGIFRTRIDEIRQYKSVSGERYIAAIMIQRAWRDKWRLQRGLQPIPRSRATKVTLHPSNFFNCAESLRNYIALNGGSNLAERSRACTIITTFLREAGMCFKGYVKKYVT